MKSKWRIIGLPNYVFGEDKKLYRLPYSKDGRSYSLREVKKQYPERYRIGDKWYSVRQMYHKVVLDSSPIVLFTTDDMPF